MPLLFKICHVLWFRVNQNPLDVARAAVYFFAQMVDSDRIRPKVDMQSLIIHLLLLMAISGRSILPGDLQIVAFQRNVFLNEKECKEKVSSIGHLYRRMKQIMSVFENRTQ